MMFVRNYQNLQFVYLFIRLIALCHLLNYMLEYTITFNNFTIYTCHMLLLNFTKEKLEELKGAKIIKILKF